MAPSRERSPPGARTFRRLLAFLRPYRWLFGAGLVLMAVSALFDAFSLILLIPFLRSLFGMGVLLPDGGRNAAERLIDRVAGGWLGDAAGLDALRIVVLLVLVAIVLKNLALYGAKLATIRVQAQVERDIRDRVHLHLQRLPLGFFDRARAGQLVSRVLDDPREAKPVVSGALGEVVRQLATVAAYLATLFALSWRLTLISLALVPVMIAVLRPVFRGLRRRFRDVYDRRGELLGRLQETVSGVRLVKAYGAEGYEGERFRAGSREYADGQMGAAAVSELASPLSEVLSSLVALALIWVGAGLVLRDGTVGPEQFLAFVFVALRMISPIKAVSQFPARSQASLAAGDRLFELLDATPEPGPAPDAVHLDRLEEAIRFEDVAFGYEPDRPVLRGVELILHRGEVVGVVGPSGAGKSTLVDLLPRFLEPDGGRITIDGIDIRDASLDSLRSLIAVVGQDTVIFHDTVRANIAYGAPTRWSAAEVEAAARVAHAHEFIRRLPAGYETLLGDRGVRLSGGQRQRIGIARALLRDPPVLILDEATSSVDPESERLIRAALRRLFEGRTVLVIAHRLSTVRHVDRILVLERGRIVEEGTHDELMGGTGPYRRLYESELVDISSELSRVPF